MSIANELDNLLLLLPALANGSEAEGSNPLGDSRRLVALFQRRLPLICLLSQYR